MVVVSGEGSSILGDEYDPAQTQMMDEQVILVDEKDFYHPSLVFCITFLTSKYEKICIFNMRYQQMYRVKSGVKN